MIPNRSFPAANPRGKKWRSEHCQERREGEGAADLDKRNAAVKLREAIGSGNQKA